MRLPLIAALLSCSALAHAQAMVEVPNPPDFLERIERQKPKPAPHLIAGLLPPPSLAEPIPPPIVAPAPPITGHWETRRVTSTIWLGAAFFSGAYAVSAGTSALCDAGWLRVPIAGPMLEEVHLAHERGPPVAMFVALPIFFDTVLQAGGVALAIATPFFHEKVWRENRRQ